VLRADQTLCWRVLLSRFSPSELAFVRREPWERTGSGTASATDLLPHGGNRQTQEIGKDGRGESSIEMPDLLMIPAE